jgi:diguanylate cyclase (GGDEF)-like protein/PAS domain S-box-containing protein
LNNMMREPSGAAPALSQAMAQLRALEHGLALAEFAPDGSLHRANASYRALLALPEGDLAGLHHRQLCTAAYGNSEAYAQRWLGLQQGHAHSEWSDRQRVDGRICSLQSSYLPVLDAHGQVSSILETAVALPEPASLASDTPHSLHHMSQAIDVIDAAIVISDPQGQVLSVNAAFTRMFGWRNGEPIGPELLALLAPRRPQPEAPPDQQGTASPRPARSRDSLVTGKQGQRYWIQADAQATADADGLPSYTVSLLTDVTLAKMHDALQNRVLEAMAREQPLSDVLDLICREVERMEPEVAATILEVDAQGLMHPLAAPSLPSSYSQQLEGLVIGPGVGSCGTAAWRNEAVLVEDIATAPTWAPYRDLLLPLGYTGCWSTPIHSSQGGVIGTFALYFRRPRNKAAAAYHQRLVQTCTHLCALALQRERQRQHIRQLAFYDSTTSLPNRSLLHAKADKAIQAAARNRETLAVLFVDLDRFKQVNDSLGRPAGDALLRHVASKLQQDLRAQDTVGRLSGDEFVLVLPRCDPQQAAHTIERLQASLAAPATIAGSNLAVSACIGVAMFPADGRDMQTLLHRADMAMYQAKSTGRGRFRFFSAEMDKSVEDSLALESALRQALQDGDLRLHYQPQIHLATGRLYGVEALARWCHPTLGEILPTRFIALAEECGLIADLGHWAVSEACRQLAQWRAMGVNVPTVSVNLSQISFHNLELPRSIANTLARHGLRPQDLTLELTETVLLDSDASTTATIAELHAQGVRLSMDDFGTGYSSLSYLRHLPVQELKLDRAFVADLEHSAVARALSSAILSIGKSLNLTVVAEGVETPAQDALLRAQGYPIGQGYLFARPMPPQDLPAWLSMSEARGLASTWTPLI